MIITFKRKDTDGLTPKERIKAREIANALKVTPEKYRWGVAVMAVKADR
tara:strand:+ start:468 stop:614 length:147 start_codon:yes stop_codon:yes gene_type:complete